jgi:ArsR family transcriptional regulator
MSAPPITHPLSDRLVELIARRFKALADPTRIRLLEHLREGEATVTDLTELVGTTQQNISKQLLLLLESGLVVRRRAGNFIYYRIADEAVFELCNLVCDGVRREIHSLAESVGRPAGRS